MGRRRSSRVAAAAFAVALAVAVAVTGVLPTALGYVCRGGYDGPVNFAQLQSHKVSEASGLASSIANEGILWTHEDQGKDPKLYAVSLKSDPPGEIVAIIDLHPWTKRHKESPDFEDIALAKCPHTDEYCIWLGDIGDNCARLQSDGKPHSLDCGSSYYLYAVPEPEIRDHDSVLKEKARDVFEVELEYPFTGEYPNIAMDSEALVVSPDGSKAWLIEKRLMQAKPWDRPTPARIYETSQNLTLVPSSVSIPLKLSTIIDNPDGVRITGADLHPTGEDLIVRTAYHGGTYLYTFDVPFDFKTIQFRGRLASNSLRQPQPEAVTFDFTNVEPAQFGKAFWHISEQSQGWQNLEYVRCKDDLQQLQVRGIMSPYRNVHLAAVAG